MDSSPRGRKELDTTEQVTLNTKNVLAPKDHVNETKAGDAL